MAMLRSAALLFILLLNSYQIHAGEVSTPVVPGQTEAQVRQALGEPERTGTNVYGENTFYYPKKGISVAFSPSTGAAGLIVLEDSYAGKIVHNVDMTHTKDDVIRVLGTGSMDPLPDESYAQSDAFGWGLETNYAFFQFWNQDVQENGRSYRAGTIRYAEIS